MPDFKFFSAELVLLHFIF